MTNDETSPLLQPLPDPPETFHEPTAASPLARPAHPSQPHPPDGGSGRPQGEAGTDSEVEVDQKENTLLVDEPLAIVDGTKLILRTKQHQAFQVDHGLKIIFSSSVLRRISRGISASTYVSDAPDTITVIDSGASSCVFVPIVPALHGGVIYTREGLAHVVVAGAGDIKRTRISSRCLPHKVCNKFVASHHLLLPPSQRLMDNNNPDLKKRQDDVSAIPLLKPWQPWVGDVAEDASASGVIYVRLDQSAFRFTIGTPAEPDSLPGQLVHFHEGRVIAWSAGVDFKFESSWCWRKVVGASGKGTIWMDNPKAASTSTAPNQPLFAA